MKSLISLAALVMFSLAMVGCHASVDTDSTSAGDSHYKKTTTYDNGTKTTKTESTVTR